MAAKNINSVISVIPVNDLNRALNWYERLFGREADVLPMEGVAEWRIIDNAWIQISTDPEHAGSTAVIIGVNDLEIQRKACLDGKLSVGKIVEYPGVIKMSQATDPEGNTISFVQEISN